MSIMLTRRQFLKISLIGLASAALPTSLAFAEAAPPPQALFRAQPSQPGVALTFDDGLVNVERFLDVCRQADVRLTLFPVGTAIEAHPDLWQRAVNEGHEIGCHTYSHIPLGGQLYSVIADELTRFKEVAKAYLGLTDVRYFRPPYGSGWSSAALQQATADFGMTVVMWNRVNTMRQLAEQPTWREALKSFQGQACSGDIFLYHFLHQEVRALAAIVEHCQNKGWRVTTLSELCAA